MNLRSATASILDASEGLYAALVAAAVVQVLVVYVHDAGVGSRIVPVDYRVGEAHIVLGERYIFDDEVHEVEALVLRPGVPAAFAVFHNGELQGSNDVATADLGCWRIGRGGVQMPIRDVRLGFIAMDGEVTSPDTAATIATSKEVQVMNAAAPKTEAMRRIADRAGVHVVAITAPSGCGCSMCDGTHRVINSMGCVRPCDYCPCAPEV